MTARELFACLGPLIAPAIERVFDRRDLCILSTRLAIETAGYFGIQAEPVPVKVILYNAAFARHVDDGFAGVDSADVPSWGDGSWSVGIGYGAPERVDGWDGHLIAVADGCFGDFSIQQAERLQHGIVTGSSLVGPYDGQQAWRAENSRGTVVEYQRTEDNRWRNAPDWKDAKRRRPIVGWLIRAVREVEIAWRV